MNFQLNNPMTNKHQMTFFISCISSEIFPYLVIVVGVENILVITKSVVSTPVDLEVKIRVAQGISSQAKCGIVNNKFMLELTGL